jgi:glutaredoxin 3
MAQVIMYKKNPCPFCDRAANLLNSKGIPFETIDLTDNLDELKKIKEQWGWQTVPILIINGKLIGGYTDLKALDDNGTLDELLDQKS